MISCFHTFRWNQINPSVRQNLPLLRNGFIHFAPNENLECSQRQRRDHSTTSTNLSLSRRDMALLEDELTSYVGRDVKDPILDTQIGTLGWLQRKLVIGSSRAENSATTTSTLTISLQLPTLLHPSLDELKNRIKASTKNFLEEHKNPVLRALQEAIEVSASPGMPFPVAARLQGNDHNEIIQRLGPGLANVSHFVAVYSCKGGVGKSTIAVNLAYELARMGGRVGLLDVDIYGPSLPVLIQPDDPAVRKSPMGQGMVFPIEHQSVKLLSLGYVSPNSGVPGSGANGGAAVMRGPMAGRVVSQLLKGTDWGELDVLLLDLPPGTSDVQLTVTQDLQLTGAVAVTTPSKVAVADALKGIEMFTALGVPTLAAVQNMAYFVCEGGGRHYPFGKEATRDALNAPHVVSLPISTLANEANDNGRPLSLARPEEAEEELRSFGELAKALSHELLLAQFGKSSKATSTGTDGTVAHLISFPTSQEHFDVASTVLNVANDKEAFSARFFCEAGALEVDIPGTELRSRDPKTGDKSAEDQSESTISSTTPMVQHHKAKERLFPANVERKGRYGYSVEYADGATIIYSMLAIAKAAGGSPVV